jgi:glycosyltransferase involved in cell wall biosynthesis
MLSVSVIVKNEEQNLPKMLESVQWADEIVVLDTGSEDNTIAIAKDFGCKVYTSEWLGFGKCKQIAVDYCSHDWILSLDADEVITESLKKKIQSIIKSDSSLAGYRILRKSFYLGKMINYCGWNKDYTMRLFQKDKGRFNTKDVHESVQINGEIGHINEYMLHYTYPTVKSHIDKMNLYTTLSSEMLHKKGKKCSILNAALKSKWKFFSMYVLKLGFLDGKQGFILSLNSGMGIFWKYIKLWNLNNK